MEPDRVLSQLLSVSIMRLGRAVSVLVLTVLFGTVCAEPEVEEKSIFNLSDKVDECSGIVASRAYPGVFWTHEDGGLSNNLYAVDEKGDFLFKTDVAGAKNVDWEDIAIDDEGFLYIADVGNNKNKREDLLVYKVSEPNPTDANAQATVWWLQAEALAGRGEGFLERGGLVRGVHQRVDANARVRWQMLRGPRLQLGHTRLPSAHECPVVRQLLLGLKNDARCDFSRTRVCQVEKKWMAFQK